MLQSLTLGCYPYDLIVLYLSLGLFATLAKAWGI